MQTKITGNSIRITLTEEDNNIVVTLPVGYSYEAFMITGSLNINHITPHCRAIVGAIYHFPVVRSKSPSTFKLLKNDATAEASVLITIVKFGQIPDPDYFEQAFEPILVTGSDGKEYNVIPSDQFK